MLSKIKNFIFSCFRFAFKCVHKFFSYIINLCFLVIPLGFAVYIGASIEKLNDPIKSDEYTRGTKVIHSKIRNNLPSELFSQMTQWEHMVPCGVYFDEAAELKKSLQCVNSKVYPKEPISLKIPRCYVVSSASPDVRFDGGFNFIAIRTFGGIGAVVGYFNHETDTLFVVENQEVAKIYRHELQHLYLEMKTGYGGGHHQDIWKQCEEPYYDPGLKTKILEALNELEEKK